MRRILHVSGWKLLLLLVFVESQSAYRHHVRVGQEALDVVERVDHEYFFVDRRIENFDKEIAGVIQVDLAVTEGARH